MTRRTPDEVKELLAEAARISEAQATDSRMGEDDDKVSEFLEENFGISSEQVVGYSREVTTLPNQFPDDPPGTIGPQTLCRAAWCSGFHHGVVYALLYLNRAPWGADEPVTEEDLK